MKSFCIMVTVFLLLAGLSLAAGCDTVANITGKPNLFPPSEPVPVFIARVPNGELYSLGDKGIDFTYLLHLYGSTGYEWGFAAGSLLKSEVNATLVRAFGYFKEQILKDINSTVNKYHIPPSIVDAIITWGLEFVLDWQVDEARPFTDPEIFQELKGLSDASGIDLKMAERIHMIGEVTRGQCSLYGIWGNATAGGKTLQLRALDWDTGAGLQNNPLITIYHPLTTNLGYPFANVGWTGWIGTLTGMSSNRLGISEIGVSYPNFPPAFGDESFVGTPFIFVERWVIQRTKSLQEAMQYINTTNRTCRLILGIADGNAQSARVVQYSHSSVNFYDDTDLEPVAEWHPRLENAVYNGMDWFCPFYQHALWQQLDYYHGKMTPELSILNVTSAVQTGDLHLAVYDLTDNYLFVANHAPDDVTVGPQQGYDRQFVKLNMTYHFNKKYGE